jgi:hypothetical protein
MWGTSTHSSQLWLPHTCMHGLNTLYLNTGCQHLEQRAPEWRGGMMNPNEIFKASFHLIVCEDTNRCVLCDPPFFWLLPVDDAQSASPTSFNWYLVACVVCQLH